MRLGTRLATRCPGLDFYKFLQFYGGKFQFIDTSKNKSQGKRPRNWFSVIPLFERDDFLRGQINRGVLVQDVLLTNQHKFSSIRIKSIKN